MEAFDVHGIRAHHGRPAAAGERHPPDAARVGVALGDQRGAVGRRVVDEEVLVPARHPEQPRVGPLQRGDAAVLRQLQVRQRDDRLRAPLLQLAHPAVGDGDHGGVGLGVVARRVQEGDAEYAHPHPAHRDDGVGQEAAVRGGVAGVQADVCREPGEARRVDRPRQHRRAPLVELVVAGDGEQRRPRVQEVERVDHLDAGEVAALQRRGDEVARVEDHHRRAGVAPRPLRQRGDAPQPAGPAVLHRVDAVHVVDLDHRERRPPVLRPRPRGEGEQGGGGERASGGGAQRVKHAGAPGGASGILRCRVAGPERTGREESADRASRSKAPAPKPAPARSRDRCRSPDCRLTFSLQLMSATLRSNSHAEDVMSRSLSYLRRGLLGIAFVGSLGFGATQAFGSPNRTQGVTCDVTGYDYPSYYCQFAMRCDYGGWCSSYGSCNCGDLP